MSINSGVCLIGLGEFSLVLGQELIKMGIDVLGLDTDAEVVQRSKDLFTMVYQLDAVDKKALTQVGIKDLEEVVVNVGHSLEAGVLICINLLDIGVKNIWAVANSKDHVKVYKRLGIKKVIFPERDVAIQVANRIYNPDFLQFLPFGRGIAVRELTVEQMAGKTLIELALTEKYRIQIIGIRNPDERRFSIIPTPNEPLQAGAKLIAVGQSSDFERLKP